MNNQLSKIFFDEQIERLRNSLVVEHHGWEIEVNNLDIFILMYSKKRPETKFLVRLRCNEYPKRAPSLQFISSDKNQEGAQYWPQVGPFNSAISRNHAKPQLCIPGIMEFHEGCHAGDSSRPWNPEKYPIIKVLENTQILLDKWVI